MVEKFLVTGGAGFIGSHLVDRLVGLGHTVRVLDDLSTGDLTNLDGVKGHVEIQIGDVRSEDDLRRAVSGVDFVVHLAALGSIPRSIDDPLTTHEVNATGSLKVALASRDAGVRRVVFASSSSVYGDDKTLPKVESMMGQVLSPYAASKLAGEHYMRLATDFYELDTVRLRFFNVFGPRQKADHVYAAVIPKFVDWAHRGEQIQIHGDGQQSRDFTYVDNNIDGILAAATGPLSMAGDVFNLACGDNMSLLRVVDAIEELSGKGLSVSHGPNRPGDILHSHADISKLVECSTYKPQISVEEGIRRTWESYDKQS